MTMFNVRSLRKDLLGVRSKMWASNVLVGKERGSVIDVFVRTDTKPDEILTGKGHLGG